MNAPRIDPVFRAGLHRQLVAQTKLPQRRSRAKLFVIAGAGAIVLAAGATAATAELWTLPGGMAVSELGAPVTAEGTGDGMLSLPPRPDAANHVRLELRCLTPGTFTFPAGSVTCTADDFVAHPDGAVSWIDVPLDAVGAEVVVSSDAGERWRLTATYLDAEPVPLAVNDRGQTYGSAGAGEEPDLIAVVATNGRQGYVDADELADATGSSQNFTSPEEALRWQEERAGRAVVVPVYLSDGVTRVGDFVVG
ncbi:MULTISPECIES: hypothetical protein [Microbacterium]|uniref:hypothetical protein n=1 Tax=Microbacterium TaxID=33882 RepID=UPI002785FF54|nr:MULTISPECIES: hypothetical protein [Microbacterium]MDQ1075697.1 hypothetical protein [Microbacterium sp. SORGH_AS_0969]MDQ1115939.1 hypothetical protein [Microbacterium testaceum]